MQFLKMAQEVLTIKKRPDDLDDFKMKFFYYYISVKGQKNKQCGEYPWSIAPEDGRWVTSRICDPLGKKRLLLPTPSEQKNVLHLGLWVIGHLFYNFLVVICGSWIIGACWPQTCLPLLYGHQGFPMLPYPAVPLLLWMLHMSLPFLWCINFEQLF